MTGKVLHYLLQDRQQFVIPGIGKFSLEDLPAEIQPGAALLKAPGKLIAFSPKPGKEQYNLRFLLPEVFGIQPAQANTMEEHFANEIHGSLKESRRYNIAGFGTLLADNEGNLQFVPETAVNQFSDSFGLRPLPARQLVVRHREADVKETPVIPLRPFDNNNKNAKRPFRTLAYAAAGVGIAMAAGSLFWLNSIGNYSAGPQAAVFSSPQKQIAVKQTAAPETEITGVKPSPLNQVSNSDQPSSIRFFVVAGSFQNPYVAKSAAFNWQKKGFETAQHFSEEKNMTRISIGGFNSKDAALAFINKNKADFTSDLWILSE
jgi:hypothetical protein